MNEVEWSGVEWSSTIVATNGSRSIDRSFVLNCIFLFASASAFALHHITLHHIAAGVFGRAFSVCTLARLVLSSSLGVERESR